MTKTIIIIFIFLFVFTVLVPLITVETYQSSNKKDTLWKDIWNDENFNEK